MTDLCTHPRDLAEILGLGIDRVTMSTALLAAEDLIHSGKPCQILTPNVDHMIRYRKGGEFAEAYHDGDLVVADGQPLIWASRWLGDPLPERVAGSDMMPNLCGLAAEKGYSVFLMGGQPGSAEKCVDTLTSKYHGLKIAGWNCPDFGFENDPTVNGKLIAEIKQAKPTILFVGVGSPKQDLWIYRHKNELGVPLSLGIGVTIDFLAGKVKRAPAFTHRIGMEWLWRLLCEPRRLWRRYLVDDMPFFAHVFKQWRQQRKNRKTR